MIWIDKRIDDPVGATSAHGLAGIWGTISCGIFTAPRLAQYNAFGDPDGGLLYSGQFTQLIAQTVGVLVAFSFVFGHELPDLRGHQGHDRAAGDRGATRRPVLDIVEHGMYGYPEQFIPQSEIGGGAAAGATVPPRRRRSRPRDAPGEVTA